MRNLEILLSAEEGITIIALAVLIAALACTLTVLVEMSQYDEEDTFYVDG